MSEGLLPVVVELLLCSPRASGSSIVSAVAGVRVDEHKGAGGCHVGEHLGTWCVAPSVENSSLCK